MRIVRQIIVYGEPYVKKNSAKSNRYGGHYRKSDNFKNWEKKAYIQLWHQGALDCAWPVAMHIKFFTKNKKLFDYTNMAEGIQDVLKKSGVIPDDNTNFIEPVFTGKFGGREIDKDHPRTVVTFIEGEK